MIAIAAAVAPSNKINQKLFKFQDEKEEFLRYDQASRLFTVTYKETHPLTTHALMMSRGEVVTKNFHELVELKTNHHHSQHQDGEKAAQIDYDWRSADTSRTHTPLMKKVESIIHK